MQSFKPFDRFVRVGDTREVQCGALRIVATIELDADTTPADFDLYGEGDYAAEWQRGEWFYCGVVLSVYCEGIKLSDNAAALWAVEANYPESDNAYLSECANELINDAIVEGQYILKQLQRVAA